MYANAFAIAGFLGLEYPSIIFLIETLFNSIPGEVTSRRSSNIATLSNIAEIVNISERETLRCFKKITGESPIQYLLKYRLIRSASVLTEYPDKNISIVAEECGFDSPAYYTKKFKEFYLCSPREYRQVHQAVF
jgi:Transcriptional regulator containing an amidase domain and an AraC-type DNA-binding HTH domain